MRASVKRASGFSGRTPVPGDKSISHRALMFAALADGRTEVDNLSPGADVRSTAGCMRAMGAEISFDGARASVTGVGAAGLRAPQTTLDCGNSGTTMRLLSGIVAGAGIAAQMDGDASLRSRPMQRVLEPLRSMGARAHGAAGPKGEGAPLTFEPGAQLVGKTHVLKIASAQVKSCLLLAGLFAEGDTIVREPELSRDHTERMLPLFGVEMLAGEAAGVRGRSGPFRSPGQLSVPGDSSSAAFLAGAAALIPGASIAIEGVSINPARVGFFRTLQRMGANVAIEPSGERGGDPVATIIVRGDATLRAVDLTETDVPSQVDEIPLFAIIASQAKGVTTIRGAAELRVKESDRLHQVALSLRAMGAEIEELPDGLIIQGEQKLRGARIDSAHDHRIAMGFTVAGLCADGETVIDGAEWADISFPGYFDLFAKLSGGAVSVSA